MTQPKETRPVPAEVQAALASLCLRLLPIWSRQLATARSQSEEAVREMLSAFNVINPVLGQLIPEGGATAQSLQPSIEQMYMGLQYQDRIGQMMTLLQEDMNRLTEILENPAADPVALNVKTWLARLESLYAMAEQRKDHADTHSGGADAEGGISFF